MNTALHINAKELIESRTDNYNSNGVWIENGVLSDYIGNVNIITVPNIVHTIDGYVFYDVKAATIILPNSVKYLESMAFA